MCREVCDGGIRKSVLKKCNGWSFADAVHRSFAPEPDLQDQWRIAASVFASQPQNYNESLAGIDETGYRWGVSTMNVVCFSPQNEKYQKRKYLKRADLSSFLFISKETFLLLMEKRNSEPKSDLISLRGEVSLNKINLPCSNFLNGFRC